MQWKLSVIHGPLLDQLGTREPTIYGQETLVEVNARIVKCAEPLGAIATCQFAPHEAACVELVQSASRDADVVIINPAALTHSSVLLRDAVAAICTPLIEVHISNIATREPFRTHSLLAPFTAGSIMGFGTIGYIVAVEAAARIWQTHSQKNNS